MYLVTYRNLFGGYNMDEHETLEEAKLCAINYVEKGYREVKLSQVIPMKVTIEF